MEIPVFRKGAILPVRSKYQYFLEDDFIDWLYMELDDVAGVAGAQQQISKHCRNFLTAPPGGLDRGELRVV
jgi:hypothetical protein